MTNRRLGALILTMCFARGLANAANDSYMTYLQGISEERAGNTAKALEAYEKAVQQDPQAVQVYRDIAELRMRSGQPDQALRAAQKVQELAPTDPMSYIFLGNVYVAQGELTKAAEAYTQALKVDPTNLRAMENLGNYYALTDPDKALTYYQKYLVISPRDADINFQMAVVYHRRGQFAKALTYYKKSIEEEPTQVASHLAIADLYETQKSTAEAISAYLRAAEVQPGNPLVLSRLGTLYYRDGKWEEAWKTFLSAEEASPNEAGIQFSLARVAEERKDWKAAVVHAEKAWTLSQDPQLLPLVAYFLTLNHEPEKAIKYLLKARDVEPENTNVMLFLGMNYMDLEKAEQARDVLAKGVELSPKDAQMRFHLGMAEDKLGHFDAAVAQFQKILEMDPKNAQAMNYLGYSWAEHGVKLEESEKLLRSAVQLDPDNGAYLDSLGWIRFKRGEACDARHFLERAVNLLGDGVIFDHLGDALKGCGQPAVALQYWTKALELSPKNEDLQKKIQTEGAKVLASSDVGKYAMYLEGNLKQVQKLTSQLQLKGRMHKKSIQAAGTLIYRKTPVVVLEVPATPKTAAVTYSLTPEKFQVEPPQKSPMLDQMAKDGLTSVLQLFSGQLTSQLKPYVAPKTGWHVRFSRPNVSGGQDVIEVTGFDYVEGLWLPSRLRVQNETTGWSAEVELSDWQLNDPGTAHAHP